MWLSMSAASRWLASAMGDLDIAREGSGCGGGRIGHGACCGGGPGAVMLPEARTGVVCLGYNRGRAVAQSLPRGVRGYLVRGAVLPAAPVRLPRGGGRAGRAGARGGAGAAVGLHHD